MIWWIPWPGELLLETAQTQHAIAQACHVSKSVISRFWNRLPEIGNVQQKHSPLSTTPRDNIMQHKAWARVLL